MKEQHPQHQPGFLPTQGVLGSSYQPISSQLYRYVAHDRSIDNPGTKTWRKQMRKLEFQIFHVAHGVYASGLSSDGQYFSSIPLRDLEPIKTTVITDVPAARLVEVIA